MSWIIPLHEIGHDERERVGGKAYALARMARQGLPVGDALCVTTEAYRSFLASTGLDERIMMELHRKDFKDMRWEELWDASLRIRNLFLAKLLPADLEEALKEAIFTRFGNGAVAVRSSAPGEDSAAASFAGLHESYVNVKGEDAVLDRIRQVWASLWSDAALLYRRELGLDAAESTMAVLVQEMVQGERSGVVFSRNPADASQSVMEAVHGLNQGLVDGAVEPDQWIVDRDSGDIVAHREPERRQWMVADVSGGVAMEALPGELVSRPPLDDKEVGRVFRLSLELEKTFGAPQDVEWTFRQGELSLLQCRPVTAEASRETKDERRWYMSLRRSFDNLKSLRRRIENELIPEMIRTAEDLDKTDLARLSDGDLGAELERRMGIHKHWVDVYWTEFIPFAHGVRLFGQVYNDVMRPADPYEFMNLLGGTAMAGVERNRMLEEMASMLRSDPAMAQAVREGGAERAGPDFRKKLDGFVRKFGDLSCPVTGGSQCVLGTEPLTEIILELADHAPSVRRRTLQEVDSLRSRFLNHFEGAKRDEAEEMLHLARTSYRLRDDDNIHLGRIEAQVLRAAGEGRKRLENRGLNQAGSLPETQLAKALGDADYIPPKTEETLNDADIREQGEAFRMQARQLVGQPAGPGIARARARVITDRSELSRFKYGEVLVCDAIDPNMTFVAPLAAAVVERRGGMLIHGAIIAREYGLPCVTGAPDVTSLIRTGDMVTVDGYLGIVTIG